MHTHIPVPVYCSGRHHHEHVHIYYNNYLLLTSDNTLCTRMEVSELGQAKVHVHVRVYQSVLVPECVYIGLTIFLQHLLPKCTAFFG